MKHLIEIITELEAKGVGFRSITENIDTTTSGGRLVFHLFGALAQFERDLIRERTRAGLQAAEERGRRGGRLGGCLVCAPTPLPYSARPSQPPLPLPRKGPS